VSLIFRANRCHPVRVKKKKVHGKLSARKTHFHEQAKPFFVGCLRGNKRLFNQTQQHIYIETGLSAQPDADWTVLIEVAIFF
jgi:hypothetical protein